MVTDHIERFDTNGICLPSGERIDSDIVITATGLVLEATGEAKLLVDGNTVNTADKFVYEGTMLDGVPNFALATGYSNASFTLKPELIAKYVCRLLNYMRRHDYDHCTAELPDNGLEPAPLMDLQSG